MNAAAIDLGTNSVKILIVRRTPDGHHQVLFKHRSPVRLGEGVFSKGKISPKVQSRTLKALSTYAKFLDAYNVETVRATGTSALREAQNGAEFVREVREKTGLALEVLPALEEARLIVKGVVSEYALTAKPVYFIDIGGGSCEVSLVQNKKIHKMVSFPFGAVRLTENFLHRDPPSQAQIKKMEQYLSTTLKKQWGKVETAPKALAFGSAGTIRALARLINKTELRSDERQITIKQLQKVVEEVSEMNRKEISALPGIDNRRADIFIAGVRALLAVFKYFGITELKVSNRGLREGLLIDLFETPTKPELKTEQGEGDWTSELLTFGRRWHSNIPHTKQVWNMAKYIFEELESVHGLDPSLKKVLMPACLLHDIGHFVGEDSHHKHTLYILRNTKFKFLTERETMMMACVARYHRKSQPKESHEIYSTLNTADRKIVTGLAAILRLADALDAPHDQSVKWVKCQWGPGKVHLKCELKPGAKLNEEVIKDKARLFEETYNVKVQVA